MSLWPEFFPIPTAGCPDLGARLHEAWLRITGNQKQQWNSRNHFFMAAAEAMRRILVENARRKRRLKHGGSLSDYNVTGVFYDGGGNRHGFLTNMISGAWTTLDDPHAAPGVYGTVPQGIYGSTVVGRYFPDLIHQYGFMGTPIPSLSLANSSNALAVSWPYWNSPFLGWTLQQNSDLTPTNWTPCTATLSNDGTNNSITLPSPAGNLFFRLDQQ